jgi:hypothetical protein
MKFPRLPYRPYVLQETYKALVHYGRNGQVLPGSRRAGFVLLLAGLIASIALSFAASIFEISQKEVLLAATARDSEYAFYAADSAGGTDLSPITSPSSFNADEGEQRKITPANPSRCRWLGSFLPPQLMATSCPESANLPLTRDRSISGRT